MNFNIADELLKISRLWPLKQALIATMVVESIFLGLFFNLIHERNTVRFFNVPIIIFIYLIVLVVTILYWLYSNRIPRNKKNKFGFVVSIYCDNDETDKKFREDFVNNLKKQICDGSTGQYFNFIEINNHVAKGVTCKKEAELILEKSKAHFIIYGRVKTRNTTHQLELQSIITHSPLPIFVLNDLSKEMSELLPRKIRIEDDNFLDSFEFTSKWAEIASKYLIGNVKLLSGDILPAFELYNEVLDLSKSCKTIPEIEQLCSKSVNNIIIILDIKISGMYEEWVRTHNIFLFQNIDRLIVEYDQYQVKNYQIETIKAIVLVMLFQDIESAIKVLSNFPKHKQNATWILNRAFLFAYQGDLTSAYREYKHALARPEQDFCDGLVNKVEDFIQLVICQDKNNNQLYYCLGILNKEFKGDYVLAKKDFLEFISFPSVDKLTKEKEIAQKWVNEMIRKMSG